MKYDDSDDEVEGFKKGNQVKISGGVKATVDVKMTVDRSIIFQWLEDDEGNMYRREKTNVEKVIKRKQIQNKISIL